MSVSAFDVPASLLASAPTRRRDAVRLLVADASGIQHTHFADLAHQLVPGDLLVINNSRTLPAAVSIRISFGSTSSTPTTVPPSAEIAIPASGRGVLILPSSLRLGRSMTETVPSSSFSV